MYDYLVCPLITILYCQTSNNSKLLSTILQAFLYSIPQTALEVFGERYTKLIHYKRGWTWVHSYVGIALTKVLFRGLIWIYNEKKTGQG